MTKYTVTYVNKDGRMLDEGIGDEAIHNFESAEDAAMYVLEQAGRTRYEQRDLGYVVDHNGMPDDRCPGYRWNITTIIEQTYTIIGRWDTGDTDGDNAWAGSATIELEPGTEPADYVNVDKATDIAVQETVDSENEGITFGDGPPTYDRDSIHVCGVILGEHMVYGGDS